MPPAAPTTSSLRLPWEVQRISTPRRICIHVFCRTGNHHPRHLLSMRVVVVADDAWRKKFLRASKITCFLVWACHAAGAFQSASEVKHLPIRAQFNERLYALWSTVVICFLPLLGLAGSIQSIRVAVRNVHDKQLQRQQQQSVVSGVGSRLSQQVSRAAASLQKVVVPPKRPAASPCLRIHPQRLPKGEVSGI
ncbi:hypothetical protein BCR44DRAFT_1241837 [Catenaria anguillulae PL171]|uniref:Uncharacterized protein n=1 Tax=Catenaria anguillulae PL171 TaxID=765915 RepID=A0A1Y2HGZ9_9FUNG|nr:hypothetical protein BCR44DRAFT_1241837 [Catenaria anguillulae PL171]